MNGKVFCIGLNKTGTSSIHAAFRILGLKSVHYQDETGASIKDMILDNFLAGRYILQGIEGYDAYSDWDKAPHTIDVFKEFDRQCPGSKFIVNTRELEAWLSSRERHVQRQQQEKRRHPDRDVPWLHVDREGWTRQYRAITPLWQLIFGSDRTMCWCSMLHKATVGRNCVRSLVFPFPKCLFQS